MGFFDEFINLFETEEIDTSFKVEMLGKTAVCITGYKKIVHLGAQEVVLLANKESKIIVSGAKLYIKKLEDSEIVIAGIILSISVE